MGLLACTATIPVKMHILSTPFQHNPVDAISRLEGGTKLLSVHAR